MFSIGIKLKENLIQPILGTEMTLGINKSNTLLFVNEDNDTEILSLLTSQSDDVPYLLKPSNCFLAHHVGFTGSATHTQTNKHTHTHPPPPFPSLCPQAHPLPSYTGFPGQAVHTPASGRSHLLFALPVPLLLQISSPRASSLRSSLGSDNNSRRAIPCLQAQTPSHSLSPPRFYFSPQRPSPSVAAGERTLPPGRETASWGPRCPRSALAPLPRPDPSRRLTRLRSWAACSL